MKKSISVGAYGWRHAHWLDTFYPDDIPLGGQDEADEDWLLTYYSNEFNTVVVPADYWCADEKMDCEGWLDDVHEDFQFLVECHECIFDYVPMSEWLDQLKKLKPQLGALILLDESFAVDKKSFASLAESMAQSLDVDIVGTPSDKIWRQHNPQTSRFACIENNLCDMRVARSITEAFIGSTESDKPATFIVNHPQLQATDLVKFRSVLEIMGF